jgi:hypothetical protein
VNIPSKSFPFVATYHVVLEPCEPWDVAGAWVAHCLDLDLLAQGIGATGAWLLMGEAVERAVIDDLRDSSSLAGTCRRAHEEDWEGLLRTLKADTRIAMMDALTGTRSFVALLTVAFVRRDVDGESTIVAAQANQLSHDAFVYAYA